jgi:hypothetical protein
LLAPVLFPVQVGQMLDVCVVRFLELLCFHIGSSPTFQLVLQQFNLAVAPHWWLGVIAAAALFGLVGARRQLKRMSQCPEHPVGGY